MSHYKALHNQMAIFGDFFTCCVFSEHVQQASDLHLKFTLRPHQSVAAEIRRGKKRRKKKERRTNDRTKI